MLESLDPPLSLDGLLKLLITLTLLSVLVALLQSDATVGAVRRAVNNIIALPLLLMVDLLSGVEMVLTSGRAQSIFANIQNTICDIVGYLRKTTKDANVSTRTHKVFLTVYRITLQYADATQLLAGRIKRAFTIVQALLTIACEAAIRYIHVLRAGRSISDDVLSICNFILHGSICLCSLLYVATKNLGNLISVIMIKIHKHFRRFIVYASFADFVLNIPAIVSHKLRSFWAKICTGLNQRLTAVLELIFGDEQTLHDSSLDSPTRISSASKNDIPASGTNYQSPWKGRLRARTPGVGTRE
ncbi:hypothetical protein KCU65_g1572, partial [Aureobasidium melanogenum]